MQIYSEPSELWQHNPNNAGNVRIVKIMYLVYVIFLKYYDAPALVLDYSIAVERYEKKNVE